MERFAPFISCPSNSSAANQNLFTPDFFTKTEALVTACKCSNWRSFNAENTDRYCQQCFCKSAGVAWPKQEDISEEYNRAAKFEKGGKIKKHKRLVKRSCRRL
jgi:hypothetical protein